MKAKDTLLLNNTITQNPNLPRRACFWHVASLICFILLFKTTSIFQRTSTTHSNYVSCSKTISRWTQTEIYKRAVIVTQVLIIDNCSIISYLLH